jgi:hypothetical protein
MGKFEENNVSKITKPCKRECINSKTGEMVGMFFKYKIVSPHD